VLFGPNSAVFDKVGKKKFSKIKVWDFNEVIVGSWSYPIRNQPQKGAAPHSIEPRRL
jgi:hypothetical protein